MNFNHRTRQGEPGVGACMGNTKAMAVLHHSPEADLGSPAWPPGRAQTPGL